MAHYTSFANLRQLILSGHDPIKILAEGDSWMAHPRRFLAFGEASNILDILGRRDDYAIFGTPENGAELAEMLAPPRKDDLSERLAEFPYDVLLFSGGGNDIVGENDFELYLTDRKPALRERPRKWQKVFWRRFEHKLEQIRALYCQLIDRARFYSRNPNIQVVIHTYDLPRPSSDGFELFDAFGLGESWMLPYMKRAGVPEDRRADIVRRMLSRFERMLVDLEASADAGPGFHVVRTQGTLGADEWRNEIHPTPEGFRKIADRIEQRIEAVVDHPAKVDRERLRDRLAPAHERIGP